MIRLYSSTLLPRRNENIEITFQWNKVSHEMRQHREEDMTKKCSYTLIISFHIFTCLVFLFRFFPLLQKFLSQRHCQKESSRTIARLKMNHPLNIYCYYMEEGVLLGTKPLVDSIRHFIRDPNGVFSVCHLCECRIVQWSHDSRLLLLLNWFLRIIKRTLHVGSKIWILCSRGKNNISRVSEANEWGIVLAFRT